MSGTCSGCTRWQALEGQDIWGHCLLPMVRRSPVSVQGMAKMHTINTFSCSAWTAQIQADEIAYVASQEAKRKQELRIATEEFRRQRKMTS